MKYCIYRITNLINGKTYIGQHKYKTLDDNYMGSGILLHKAYKKYGIENFKKEIICKNVQYKETIDDMERFYIKKEREQNPFGCYNITDGGEGGSGPRSDETRKKISKAQKGKKVSEETRKKMSEALKGKECSKETRKKLSEANKGKHHSEETKKHLSEVNTGHKVSEETKKKISEALKGNLNFKGKHHSEETKKRLSEVHKGNTNALGSKRSKETRKKISEAIKGTHWKLVEGHRVWFKEENK